MKAIVNPEVAKFVDGLVARHVVGADPHVVERLKVEMENFVNDFTAVDDEPSGPSATDLDKVAAEQKAAEDTASAADKGEGSEID